MPAIKQAAVACASWSPAGPAPQWGSWETSKCLPQSWAADSAISDVHCLLASCHLPAVDLRTFRGLETWLGKMLSCRALQLGLCWLEESGAPSFQANRQCQCSGPCALII